MDSILEIAALKKYYGKEPNLTRALDGISFQVMPGEFLGIMGSSGSGKSTLLNCIATVIAPTAGAVALHGKCVTTLPGKALADYRGKEARALILDPEIVLADEPTGALDSKNARALMEKLSGLNADAGTTILMVTHDCNAASYCKRILFIQDGVLFHELRRDVPDETQQAFYGRILSVMAQLGGGSANVL